MLPGTSFRDRCPVARKSGRVVAPLATEPAACAHRDSGHIGRAEQKHDGKWLFEVNGVRRTFHTANGVHVDSAGADHLG